MNFADGWTEHIIAKSYDRFSDPDFLKESYNLAIMRHFHAVTFDTSTLDLERLFRSTNAILNLNEIEQSEAELLTI